MSVVAVPPPVLLKHIADFFAAQDGSEKLNSRRKARKGADGNGVVLYCIVLYHSIIVLAPLQRNGGGGDSE